MRSGIESSSSDVLLLAEPLAAAGLSSWLLAPEPGTNQPPPWQLAQDPATLRRAPQLVIWQLDDSLPEVLLRQELLALQERWQPAPLLLLLPHQHRYGRAWLLQLPVEGLLERPDGTALREAVLTLLAGGRVLQLQPPPGADPAAVPAASWVQVLLRDGLEQIELEQARCLALIEQLPPRSWPVLVLQGRVRELSAAAGFLRWLWGPLHLAWTVTPAGSPAAVTDVQSGSEGAGSLLQAAGLGSLAISLRQRTADGLWQAMEERLRQAASLAPQATARQLLALDALRPERRADLLLALLEQFALARAHLQQQHPTDATSLAARWQELQPQLRQAALQRMAGLYVQLPRQNGLQPVADTLLRSSNLLVDDPELPDPQAMLATLVEARPLLVDGRLVAADEPLAVLHLELLLSNWLIRSAEQISADVLAVCADWPELRRYLLRPELLATRSLERLRNRLNAQQRWNDLVQRPVRLYESRRPLYCLEAGAISQREITEPRDAELQRLSLPQQLVTLALETRDALAPQLQALGRRLGRLVGVLLTQVLGRAIGLVGRGVVQGMGQGLRRADGSAAAQ